MTKVLKVVLDRFQLRKMTYKIITNNANLQFIALKGYKDNRIKASNRSQPNAPSEKSSGKFQE